MRHANGYGSVYKLSGNRRRPFIVRITIGWNKAERKQLYKTLGYYETQKQAISALAEFNKNPYSIDAVSITFSELYEKWFARKEDKISASNINGYKMAYNICKPLHDLRFVILNTDHLQDIIDNCGKGYDTLRKVRVLFNQLYDYAMEKDIVSKNYAEYIDMPEKDEDTNRRPFTDAEIKLLWENVGRIDYLDTVLIMIYTGMRIGELLIIKNSDIHLAERYMRGGIKTPTGKNRVIPINRKIHDFISSRMDPSNEFLVLNSLGKQMKYENYKAEKWASIMEQLGLDHNPHDCRHTFATLMDNAGANKLSIKRIMGHASQDITDKIYTHKDIEELIKAIDLI